MFKIYSRYGIWIAIALIVYFLLLRVIGLHLYPTLSFVNGFIFGVGIYKALKKYKNQNHDFKFENGYEVGILSGAIATLIFTAFMAVYMYQIDTNFASGIMERWNLEHDLGTLLLVLTILIMGFATTFVLNLAFMQLLKKSWNPRMGKRSAH